MRCVLTACARWLLRVVSSGDSKAQSPDLVDWLGDVPRKEARRLAQEDGWVLGPRRTRKRGLVGLYRRHSGGTGVLAERCERELIEFRKRPGSKYGFRVVREE